jgi:hypothetical protein
MISLATSHAQNIDSNSKRLAHVTVPMKVKRVNMDSSRGRVTARRRQRRLTSLVSSLENVLVEGEATRVRTQIAKSNVSFLQCDADEFSAVCSQCPSSSSNISPSGLQSERLVQQPTQLLPPAKATTPAQRRHRADLE